MKLNRRRFLELLGCTATAAAIPTAFGYGGIALPIQEALAAVIKTSNQQVVWIQGQACTGCSISTLNTVYPDIVEILTESMSLIYHPAIMGGTGDVSIGILNRVIKEKKGEIILIVEGAIPTGEGAEYCTFGLKDGKSVTSEQWLRELGAAAKAVLAVGTCASFGGIPAANPKATNATPVSKILPEATLINIPGCPIHPDWLIGTLTHVLLYGLPELDDEKRPTMFYCKLVHEQCERRANFEDGEFAENIGDDGCLFELGCKGVEAHCDGCIRGWNNHSSWCIRTGSPCIGCTEPDFPDFNGEGIYSVLPIEKTFGIKWTNPYKKKQVIKV